MLKKWDLVKGRVLGADQKKSRLWGRDCKKGDFSSYNFNVILTKIKQNKETNTKKEQITYFHGLHSIRPSILEYSLLTKRENREKHENDVSK